MLPRPRAVPAMPKQARPAPMNFAASASMNELLRNGCCGGWTDAPGRQCDYSLVPRMDRVVQVHASQYREDIGLEEGDEDFETGDGNGHDERQDRAADTDRAE